VNIRILAIATVATLAIGGLTVTAQAGVVGPTSTMQSSAQTLDLTQKARRICKQVFRCAKFLQCHWEKQCYITADYPPEHNRNR
jgi:hypothetical protein